MLFLFLISLFMFISLFPWSWKNIILSWGAFFKNKFSFASISFFIVFISILLFNLLSLIPFSSSSPSHIWFSAFLSISLFFSSILLFFFLKLFNFLSHLIPAGSPLFLSTFLFIIEVVSMMVRPLTLILRLCANLTAGHVMLSLIGGFISSSEKLSIGATIILFGLLFLTLEVAVCFIQALVFSLLLESYYDEILAYSMS